jgi:hypothetical protein
MTIAPVRRRFPNPALRTLPQLHKICDRRIDASTFARSGGALVRGQCLCGAVRFEIEPPWRWFAHCHCSVCRRHHGSLFSTSIGADAARFGWIAGEQHVRRYRSSPTFERPFCGRCGSKLPGASHRPDVVNVPAGTVDGELGGKPRTHIFVGSKSSCERITDALPQYHAYPPGVDVPELPRRPPSAASGGVAGGCGCGAVTFEIAADIERLIHSHGVGSRRSRGAAHASDFIVAAHRLRWTGGATAAAVAAVDAPGALAPGGPFTVTFCRRCGGLLPSALYRPPPEDRGSRPTRPVGVEAADWIIVPIGAMDPAPAVHAAIHVFVGTKAPWHEVTDTLPQYPALPGGLT